MRKSFVFLCMYLFFLYSRSFSSALMAEMNKNLNLTEESLSEISADNNSTYTKLNSLKEEADKLKQTVKDLQEQVEFVKNSDIRGEQHHNATLTIEISSKYHFDNESNLYLQVPEKP